MEFISAPKRCARILIVSKSVVWYHPFHLDGRECLMKLRIHGTVALAFALSVHCFAQTAKQPVTLRTVLLHELRSTHNQADWFVPMNTALEGMTVAQANWQPPGGGHSVGQLAYHLLFWDRRNLAKLKGEAPGPYDGNNKETFDKFEDKDWKDTVHQLDRVMLELESLVESADDAKLASIAPTIANLCTHNAYHIGQIVYVRKLQGSWNADNGVK